jgi:hypothetical protein
MRSMLRPLSIAKAVLCACGWASVLLLGGVRCRGQQAQASGLQEQTPVFTLKVYTNLVQVPTLVLDSDHQPLPRIDFQRFQVSLDGGRQFPPTHVRMEGTVPLNVAILVDVGKHRADLVVDLAGAMAETAMKELHPQDHISIYLLSCNMLRTVYEVQPFPGLLSSSIEMGLQSPKLGKDGGGASCGANVYLWGAMTTVIKDMSETAGRRAILVVSNGHDDGSAISWAQLHEYAGYEGVALFGLRETPDLWPAWQRDHTDPFRSLCESTGGIVMAGDRRDLPKQLRQWIELLRGRYVVEFPRPQTLSSGQHDIVVSIKKDGMAFTTLAGVSVSLPDPTITTDPNYVPSDEGSDIPVGKRRPLPH